MKISDIKYLIDQFDLCSGWNFCLLFSYGKKTPTSFTILLYSACIKQSLSDCHFNIMYNYSFHNLVLFL